jgi:hypothetical protein
MLSLEENQKHQNFPEIHSDKIYIEMQEVTNKLNNSTFAPAHSVQHIEITLTF